MHFNNKYIFLGDSEIEIKKKINYNFDQILSFAIGPEGHPGPKGSVGLAGPGGYKGATGSPGLRGTIWYKQNLEPQDPNQWDLWINTSTSDYVVNLWNSSAWVDTGYSLFTSPYFKTYSGLIGPAGVTDKFAIGIKSGAGGLNPAITQLRITDSSTNSYSDAKVFISTESQTQRPIFDFSKSGSVSKKKCGFYWADSDLSSYDINLMFDDGIEIISGDYIDLTLRKSSYFGKSFSVKSEGVFYITGNKDLRLSSNTTVGTGGDLSLSSLRFSLTSSLFSLQGPIKMNLTSSSTASYVFDSTKNLASGSTTSSAGIEILADSSVEYTFEFRDHTNSRIFSGRPRGSASSGKHSQITFGSTGGQPGGATGGPYFYGVKRLNEVKLGASQLTAFMQTSNTLVASTSNALLNCFDLSNPNIWTNDLIVLTPTSYLLNSPSSGYERVYIRIPSSISNTLDGVYYSGSGNTYRIMLNDNTSTAIPRYIYGLVFSFFTRSNRGNITSQLRYVNFETAPINLNSRCQYIDIFYSPIANPNNANPRVFWRTCNGLSGYITLSVTQSFGTVVSSGVSGIVNVINNTTQPNFA